MLSSRPVRDTQDGDAPANVDSYSASSAAVSLRTTRAFVRMRTPTQRIEATSVEATTRPRETTLHTEVDTFVERVVNRIVVERVVHRIVVERVLHRFVVE